MRGGKAATFRSEQTWRLDRISWQHTLSRHAAEHTTTTKTKPAGHAVVLIDVNPSSLTLLDSRPAAVPTKARNQSPIQKQAAREPRTPSASHDPRYEKKHIGEGALLTYWPPAEGISPLGPGFHFRMARRVCPSALGRSWLMNRIVAGTHKLEAKTQ